MTPEQIQDALTLLPADLIAEADRRRSQPPRNILPWKRYAAMAACFALVLGCFSLVYRAKDMTGSAKTESILSLQEAAAEAPAAAADTEQAAQAAPKEPLPDFSATQAANSNPSNTDHSHFPAESEESGEPAATCGITGDAAVFCRGETWVLSGEAAAELTQLLYTLEYREEALCRCTAAFRVDTELGTGYEISLEQAFVRIAGAQAILTEEEVQTLTRLLEQPE